MSCYKVLKSVSGSRYVLFKTPLFMLSTTSLFRPYRFSFVCSIHFTCPFAAASLSAKPDESDPQGKDAAMKIMSSTFTKSTVSPNIGEQSLEL